VSAVTGENLDRLRDEIFRLLPEGAPLYPEDDLSDRNQRFFMGEIIREKIILLTRQEIPHAAAVVVESSTFQEGAGLWRIHATIYVEKESQKSIVIGTGGRLLREIGRSARLELQGFLQGRVYLELWVKVRKNWTKDPQFLAEIGYSRPA
jgi:GTPase